MKYTHCVQKLFSIYGVLALLLYFARVFDVRSILQILYLSLRSTRLFFTINRLGIQIERALKRIIINVYEAEKLFAEKF